MTPLKYVSPGKSKFGRRTFWWVSLFLVVALSFWWGGRPSTLLRSVIAPVSVFSQITGRHLKATDGRTNVLLLGLDRRPPTGGQVWGTGLTDTLIVISFSEEAKDAALLSLPRDLWVSPLGYKINALYAVGGIDLVRTTLAKILDVPLHYYAVVDFTTFEKAVDLVGGVEVDVPEELVDDYYPLPGREEDTCGLTLSPEATSSPEKIGASSEYDFPCRFEKIYFKKGRQRMDGAQALKYVRTRHAMGDEGTDFARARRQQQVLESLVGKALSWEVLLNPLKLKEMFDSFRAGVETNVGFWEVERVYSLGRDFDFKKVRTAVLTTDNVLLHPDPAPDSDYQWILVPRGGDFSEVALFAQRLFFGEGKKPK